MHSILPDVLLERFSRFVEARAGLHFPRERWPDLARALRAAAVDLGSDDPEACAERFISERATPEELAVLFSRLTVGETYFFRDPSAFDVLEQRALPELIRARRPTAKRLRIWSAGCCSGEEPYSIAIAVSRALPDLADWEVTIVGTDLNPRFLQKAKTGVYSKWSFRGTSEAFRTRYFRQTAENRFEIIPSIRKLVTFVCLNLVEDHFPSLLTNTNAMDVIFCRNVLMYFSPEQAQKVTANLHRTLVDDGWLFPSGTEASRELYGRFTAVDVRGTIVYRKMPAPLPPEPLAITPATARRPELRPMDGAETVLAANPPPARLPATTRARQLADEGHLDAALAACDEALRSDKLAPLPHYLRGLILQEQGARAEAAAALRRALYLDPDFVLVHFALGNLMRHEGRANEAARCFENVRRLLRDRDPNAVLPEADGLTAGRLLATLETPETVS